MYPPDRAHAQDLETASPHSEWFVAKDLSDAAEKIVSADAVLGNRHFMQSLPKAERLRWMQSNSMGVDLIVGACATRPDLCITSVRGVYDDEVADHAVALLCALVRGLPEFLHAQGRQAWTRRSLRRLSQIRTMILGWGGVGQSIGRRLRAFGCPITAVRRTHSGPPAWVEDHLVICGPSHWRDRLRDSDALILALPKTDGTTHLVSSTELALMPHGSFVVNVGRGGTLDEKALQEALHSEHIQSAGLDVCEAEPLPPAHWMWSHPRIVLTPHVGRSVETPPFRWEKLFVENVRRFHRGEPLLNIVDRTRGY